VGGENVCIALVIHHAMRMRPMVLPFVACPTLPYFPTLSQKWHEFRKRICFRRQNVLLFPLLHLSERVLILRRIQRGIIINVHRSTHSVVVILVRF
jgi:hypothetical protein